MTTENLNHIAHMAANEIDRLQQEIGKLCDLKDYVVGERDSLRRMSEKDKLTIDRQVEAIRMLRGIVAKLCYASYRSESATDFSILCDEFIADALEALAQTKEFGE